MKKLLMTASIAMLAMTGAASANAMTPKTVNYSCQGGKNLYVKYFFNQQGLPTKAQAKLGGKNRVLPINLAQSDRAGTTFGGARNYMIGTDYVDYTTYNKVTLSTITAPNNKIIYKECRPN